MNRILLIAFAVTLAGCIPVTITSGDSVSDAELEKLFRKHKVDQNYAVAVKKRSLGVSYLATIHGYRNNFKVCIELIAPLNKDPSLSDVPGEYYCEVLR